MCVNSYLCCGGSKNRGGGGFLGIGIVLLSLHTYPILKREYQGINDKLNKHCMLTTIKVHVYAYFRYTVKIHKNILKKNFKHYVSPGSAFALLTFETWYRDPVLDTVRLTANKIKSCKSLMLLNHLPIVHPQCISTINTPTNVTIFLNTTNANMFDSF